MRRLSLLAGLLLLLIPAVAEAQASLVANPVGQSDGGTVTLSGGGFAASTTVTFTFDGSPLATNPATVTTDASGNLPSGLTFTVPGGTPVGSHIVAATDGSGNSPSTQLAVDSISVSPAGQSDGGMVTVSGSGFAPSSPVTISLDGTTVGSTTSDGGGSLPSGVTFNVPAGFAVGSHTVSATDGSGDIASTPLAVDSISVNPAGQSDGGTVTVSGSGFAPSSPITIKFNGTTVASTTSDSGGNLPSGVTFSVPGGTAVGSYTVSATDGSGDTASTPLAVDNISVNPAGQSERGTVTVSGSGFAPSSPITIKFNGTTVASTTSDGSGNLPSGVTFNVPHGTAVGSYPVTATDGSGDTASSSLNVDSILVSPAGQSGGGPVTVTGSGFALSSPVTISLDGTTVATTTSDGSGNLPSGVTFNVPGGTPAGSHNVFATDGRGDTATTPLRVDKLTVSPAGQRAGRTVTLAGSGFAPATPVTFTLDGTTLTTNPASVTTDGSGGFTNVTFTVPNGTAVGSHTVAATDGNGDTASNPLTVDSISVNPTGQSVGGTVAVSGSGFAPGSTVTISLNGATVATPTADASGNLPASAAFTVPPGTPAGSHTVTATDGSGDTATASLGIDSVSITPTSGAAGNNLTVSGAGWHSGDGIQVQINGVAVCQLIADSGGNISGTQTNGCRVPPASELTPGTYPVTAADVGSSAQATAPSSDDFTVEPGPTAAFSAPATARTGSQVTFTDSSTTSPGDPITKWEWNWGDGTNDVATSGGTFTHTYAEGKTYTVTLKVTDSTGQTNSVTQFIQVEGPLTASFALPPTVSTGTPVTFVATPDDPGATTYTYNWDFGDGASSTFATPTYAYNTPGSYQVKLTVMDTAGNTSTTQPQIITVTPRPPIAAFNPSSATVLAGSSVAFDGTPSSDPNGGGTLSYSWNFGDGGTATGPQPGHTYAMPGTYTVTLSLSDNYGQTSSITHQITVIAPPPIQTLILTPVANPTIVKDGRVSATRSGVIDLGKRVFCPGPGPHCSAYIVAWSRSLLHGGTAARINRRAIAATEVITIKPDGSAEVKFSLSKRAFAFLRTKHRLPINVKITVARGQQSTTSVVTLVFVLR